MSEKTIVTVGYEGGLESLEVRVPDGEPAPWDAKSKLAIVSGRTPRIDGAAKVSGRAVYTFDVQLPGMLHARVLRATLPAGRITAIDVTRARHMPGVRAVWAEKKGKRVFYEGQEVAAVAAASAAEAEDALRAIAVEYEELPFVIDATEAKGARAPRVFGGGAELPELEPADDFPGAKTWAKGNTLTTVESHPDKLDVARAFNGADAVVEATFRTQVQTHAALETHGSVAKWDGDHLTVWTSTQATFGVREEVGLVLGLSGDKVKVICEYMGGGFGAKFSAGHWSILAARLAKEAGAPVKLMLDRKAEHLCTGNRPDSVQQLKIGAKRDGTLQALHLVSWGTPGVGTGAGTGGPAKVLYNVHAWQVEESEVYTNAGGAQPFRAPGHPQGCFALEQAVDELAEKLGMDPVALRKKNLANSVQAAELDRAVERSAAWRARGKPGAGAGTGPGNVRRGVGLACGVWYKIASRGVQVQVDVHGDGHVEVKNGAQDIGTGTRTVLAMVVAEELGLPLDAVSVSLGDTSLPFGPGSGGSCTAASLAPAARNAAFKAKQKLYAAAAPLVGASAGELEARGGNIVAKNGKSIPFKKAASRLPGGKLSVIATREKDYAAYRDKMGGVQIAEVAVDTATGVVRVERVTVVQDFGRPINRLTAESQINGGVIQGVSYALFEERRLDPNVGRMLNANLESYKILGANDCPAIDVVTFDVSNAGNSTSTVGLGEPPTVPTAAAIANAVYNAIGVRMRELPITPERVLAGLAARGSAGGAR